MTVGAASLAVIITGGAGGLGRAMTLGLAKAGVRVAAAELASRQAAAEELLQLARSQGLDDRIAIVNCDVTSFADCSAAVQRTIDRFGAVHGLVNNAGIGMQDIGPVQVGTRKRFYEVDAATWCGSIETNVCGPYRMARAIAPVLVRQGWGRIVNITTSHFTMVMEGFSPYGPSKAALEAATVIWAKDLADTGVTVNALVPGGPANTRMIPLSEVPDRSTLIQPEVMIGPICWLMSRQSDGVTNRRIIAKDWNGAIAREAPAQVGAPAGW
ncbi:MAG: SDR family NAD(P)-dependent oxidoreductase [Rhizobiales bacterium]|nr:SDR family NAD(P)-dependent oxidoreductase [Hyphomicrobiales bacterium]